MKIINQIDVTDAMLTSSTIAEDDYAAWDVATTYAVGDFVISTTTHRIYRSLTADNLGNDPVAQFEALNDPLVADPSVINWQDFAATDRWKLFDIKPTQQATDNDNITVSFTPSQFIGACAGFGISANTVTVSMVDPSAPRRNLLTYSEQFDNAAFTKTTNGAGIAPVVTNNFALSPIGTMTADRVVFNANGVSGSDRSIIRSPGISVPTINHAASVYIKSNTGSNQSLNISIAGAGLVTAVITPEWQRFETDLTLSGTVISFQMDTRSDGQADVLIWGAQLEEGTEATSYQFVVDSDTFDKRIYSQTIAMQDDSAAVDWYAYFFEPIEELEEFVVTDLPTSREAVLTVSIDRDGSTVSVGQVLFGPLWESGLTTSDGTGFTGFDFSEVVTDAFGNLTRTVRSASRLNEFSVFLDADRLSTFKRRMNALRGGKPAVWIGAAKRGKSAITYGILRNYRVAYETNKYSLIALETQELV